MTVNQNVRGAVRRALTMSAIAMFGAAGLTANAKPAPTPVPKPQSQTTPTPAAAPETPTLQTIVVTGTMISRPQLETAEAITIVKATALKDMGIVTVEQAVDQLTSNVPGVNIAQSISTFTGGGSYANLRGIGASHTLVLLDGQRLANNVVLGNSVDLSGIPFGAIQSVQVLREGASSLYGSDAIGGVINFITKKNYQGGEVNFNFSRPQESGGGSGEADFTVGYGDLVNDGYNAMITMSYTKQQELKPYQRSFAATGFDPERGLENQNGPTATWPGSYTDPNGNIWQVGYPTCAGNPHLTEFNGDCAYEYSAAVDLIPKSQELSGMAAFTKTLPANNSVELQYFWTHSKVTQWIGPQSYSFYMTPQNNPSYFPTAAQSTCYGNKCAEPPALTGEITAGWTDPDNNRIFGDINTEQRVLLTLSGANAGWNYKANLNYSVNKNIQDVDGGEADYSIIAPGNILSPLINPFGPQTAAGQALINSAYMNGQLASGKLQLFRVGGHASHALGDAFDAGTPATLAIGFDAEEDRINFASTPLAATLYTATYYPPQAISGSRTSQAIFAELDVPMSKNLDVDISDREDRYSDFGNTNNGKLSIRYQPFRILTLRAAASTGFRAPSLVDLYAPDVFGADAGSGMLGPDCASGPYTPPFTYTACTSQGLALSGGNRDLEPESSENFDLGFVVEPLTNLGITVDYYRILIKDEIQSIPDTVIYANPSLFASKYYVLNNAGTFTPAPEANTQCSPSYTAPTCGYVIQTTQNTGGLVTDGFDLSALYSIQTPVGGFHVDLEGTAVTHFHLQEYTGGPQLDLVGWYNGGNQPAIRWQHILTLSWMSPKRRWGAGLVNRFFSSYIDQYLIGPKANLQRKVANQSDWDGYVSYKPIKPLTVVVGARNLLNTNPPFSNQSGAWPAGYNPVFSSPLLRTFYVNLKYDFR